MEAVIKLDVPDWQIGQPVTIYFKDTMQKRGTCTANEGQWIDHKDEHQCPVCRAFTFVDYYVWLHDPFNNCPWCGAKLTTEAQGEDKD